MRGHEMKMSFAKPVTIPMNPVFVPAVIGELLMPPPPSGLPFNGQPRPEDQRNYQGPLPRPGAPPPLDGDPLADAWHKVSTARRGEFLGFFLF